MSFLGPVLKRAVLVCTTLNVNELHIAALPLDHLQTYGSQSKQRG